MRNHHSLWIILTLLSTLLLLPSCSTGSQDEVTQTVLTSFVPSFTPTSKLSPIPPTNSPSLTATVTPSPTLSKTSTPTDTVTLTETSTVTPSPTATATPTKTSGPAWADPNVIRIYVTHLGTDGPLACGDSLVGISSGFIRSGDTEKDIATALNTLFASGQNVGAFHNATYPSSFRVSEVEFKKSKGTAIITLGGSYVKPSDRCEALRYREQVWATARHFPEVHRVTIFLNDGKLLGDLLYAVSSKKP